MARPASVFAFINDHHQREALTRLWKEHSSHYTRVRAHAILLSDAGYEIAQIVDIFDVDRDSVASWIHRFEQLGAIGLHDEDRPGAPPRLDDGDQQILKELLQQQPSQPNKVLAELKARTGKSISRDTLRRYAKRFGLSWKRFRRSLRKKRDEKMFRVAQQELAELLQEPNIDVVYFDEAGFSLKGVVPYGWLPVGKRGEVPVTGSHGSSVQVLGLEHPNGTVHAYLHKGYVTTETVIAVLDDFSETIDRNTVVVLDNASCHTSHAFESRLDAWAERGLLVYHLPAYSPELNAIERLWKKLKYQLLPVEAWERFKKLLGMLTTTLNSLGETTYLPSLHQYTE